ncbi:SRPBCC family protein [Streptomyces purpurascens]|uniref:SRPBCC family protein n=1 Tax=Streptomyces purpurascens TaxID=1924 RepID=UPI0019CAADFC|nr:SRPBCC domain-containing protein [Streptomyces purpurascens]MCE7050221.1 SRPBCC domain-containing protein [Streptomyces purpurascens]GHA57419.1 activator of HSP90 ATPase [Streptomyces purpurascens]
MAQDGELRLHLRYELEDLCPVVFRKLTDPQELARWWGPDGFSTPSVEIDLRPGGAYRIAMQPPEGELFHLVGEFIEVDPPVGLSYTFRWEDPDPEDRETVVTLSLYDTDVRRSELTLDQGDFATERRRALHEEGWVQGLGKLGEMLASQWD